MADMMRVNIRAALRDPKLRKHLMEMVERGVRVVGRDGVRPVQGGIRKCTRGPTCQEAETAGSRFMPRKRIATAGTRSGVGNVALLHSPSQTSESRWGVARGRTGTVQSAVQRRTLFSEQP
jgi:hypothetical protein